MQCHGKMTKVTSRKGCWEKTVEGWSQSAPGQLTGLWLHRVEFRGRPRLDWMDMDAPLDTQSQSWHTVTGQKALKS